MNESGCHQQTNDELLSEAIEEQIHNNEIAEDNPPLLAEAIDQLSEIKATTEEASQYIMDSLEHCFALQQDMQGLLGDMHAGQIQDGQLQTIREMSDAFGELLIDISTRLSFHDLITQRTVKALQALQNMSGTSFVDVPQTSHQPVNKEASLLLGPTKDTSQSDVDEMLRSLGL